MTEQEQALRDAMRAVAAERDLAYETIGKMQCANQTLHLAAQIYEKQAEIAQAQLALYQLQAQVKELQPGGRG